MIEILRVLFGPFGAVSAWVFAMFMFVTTMDASDAPRYGYFAGAALYTLVAVVVVFFYRRK